MVDHTCFKQSVSNLTYACAGAEISCPYRYEDSCHIRGTGTLSIIVPEEYDYGYLDLKSDEAAASVTVQCSPDHKDTMTSTLEWTQSTSEYQCTESGASYCCPFGERFRYQPNQCSIEMWSPFRERRRHDGRRQEKMLDSRN